MSWYLVVALAAVDVLAIAIAPTVSPVASRSGASLTDGESDYSQVERLYQATLAAEPGIRAERMRAGLDGNRQVQRLLVQPCHQVELSYGQVDPCG